MTCKLYLNKRKREISMKKINLIFRFSLMLNVISIIGFVFIGYKLRTEIYNKISSQKSYKYNIVMLGSSFTAAGNWKKGLNRIDIKNSGISGYTTSQFDWRLKESVIKYNPKICFIQAGINDIEVGIPLNRTFMNYQSIVDRLIKNKIEPVLQSIFYVNYSSNHFFADLTNLTNSRVDSLNNYLSTLAIKKGIEYIDLNQYLSVNGKLNKKLSNDGVHINDLGYKIWIREVDKILKTKGI